MDPQYFFFHASREREVTSVSGPRRRGHARSAAAWLLMAFAYLAVPVPALAAEAAVHQKSDTAYSAPAAAESARPYWTSPAVRETPDSLLNDGGDDEAIRIHPAWTPSLARSWIAALPTSIASPVILTGGSSPRGPPAPTSFTS